MLPKHKQPSILNTPTSEKKPRAAFDHQQHDRETVVWRFSVMDQGGPWGWHTIDFETFKSNIKHLCNFETMRWCDLLGRNNHLIETYKICSSAKKRLEAIQQDDNAFLVSLRLGAQERIWGIRDGRALKLLWWDPEHTVMPVEKKHT